MNIFERVRCADSQRFAQHWSAPGKLVSVGSHRLHLNCMGQGELPMILEAGMGGWSQDWSLIQSSLSQHGPICSYDRAGYGWSDVSPTTRNGLAAVDDLRSALRLAGVPTPRLLVGHSLGGLLISLYARAYPDEVAGLAFIDAVGRDYVQQFPAKRYRTFRANLDRILRLADWTAPLGLAQCLNQPANIIANRLSPEQRASALARSFSARSYRTLQLENEGFDAVLQEALELGKLPDVLTIVLSSAEMRDFPPGLEDEVMRQAWRKNQLSIANESHVKPIIMANSGHYLHIDQPVAVIQQLNLWRNHIRSRHSPFVNKVAVKR